VRGITGEHEAIARGRKNAAKHGSPPKRIGPFLRNGRLGLLKREKGGGPEELETRDTLSKKSTKRNPHEGKKPAGRHSQRRREKKEGKQTSGRPLRKKLGVMFKKK